MRNEIDKFLATKTPNTKRLYTWYLYNLAEWLEKEKIDPAKFSKTMFYCWLDEQPTWGPNTRRLATCAIRAFYRFWQGDQHPILAEAKIKRVKVKPQRALNGKQVVKLLSAFNLDDPIDRRDAAICCLMIDTGLREAEVCRLEMKHIDFENRFLHVIVKGGLWGRAVFSEVTADQMKLWLTARFGLKKDLDTTVFVNTFTGKRLVPSGLRKIFLKITRKSGIQVSAHDLRRTFATLATRNGAPTRVTMTAGRWNDINVFTRYTSQIEPEDMEPWFPIKRLAEGL